MFSAPTASTSHLNEPVLKMDAVWARSRASGDFTYGLFFGELSNSRTGSIDAAPCPEIPDIAYVADS